CVATPCRWTPSCRPRSGSRCWRGWGRVRASTSRYPARGLAGAAYNGRQQRRACMSQLDFVVAVPAGYGASRMPSKAVRLLGGEPLVADVARRALAAGAREVWLDTDDARVAEAVAGEPGVRVAMTSADHASGTDRLAECADIAGWSDDTLVVNLQGDEPFAPASGIRQVATTLAASGAAMATLAEPVDAAEVLLDRKSVV